MNTSAEGKKSLEVDESKPPKNVGHGFVMFKDAESVNKALAAGSADTIQIVKCRPKEARTDINKVYNNIYIKNLPNNWDESKIREVFGRYGDIKSAFVDTKKDKEGNDRKFAFVCFDRENGADYGRECARKAVEDLHDKDVEGNKLYVQPFLPFLQRQAQVKRDQLRFKNSKKKCNLFVKGFPQAYKEEQLRNLFKEFGEIESVKILESNEANGNSTRAFVCFKQPDSAV
jgi:polyadenylate-binding protein